METERQKRFYEKYMKRPMDFVLALLALVALSPLMLVITILVRIKLGSPVIFRQERPGLHEKIFTLYKFRTMTDKRDETGELLPDGERLTGFGRWLRSTSLDELPELWNILKGDMSIVGPRPLLVEYIPFYNERQRRRHEVRPGLTGLAQVNGRNAISWEEKFEFDLRYIESVSFRLDIIMAFMTIGKIIKRSDINQDETNKTGKFRGSKGNKNEE